jgi:hypothetical protein
MNDDIPSRVLAIEARGRYEVSYFALKRAQNGTRPLMETKVSAINWIKAAVSSSQRRAWTRR